MEEELDSLVKVIEVELEVVPKFVLELDEVELDETVLNEEKLELVSELELLELSEEELDVVNTNVLSLDIDVEELVLVSSTVLELDVSDNSVDSEDKLEEKDSQIESIFCFTCEAHFLRSVINIRSPS